MIKNTKPADGVTATSPFLTIDQAAAELNIQPIGVLRLIARRRLTGYPAGPEHWKVTPRDLAEYVAGGSVDLRVPDWDAQQEKPIDHDGVAQADNLRKSVVNAMIALAPSSLDGVKKDANGKYPTLNVRLPAASIVPLLSAEYLPLVRSREPSRYATRGIAYSVVGLRGYALSLLQREGTVKDGVTPRTTRERLYASPEEYDRITAAAWRSFLDNQFQMPRVYPSPTPGENPVRISYKVSHADLNFDFKTAANLAF